MKRALILVLCCLLLPLPAWAADAPLAPGASGGEVTALQKRLAELFLFSGKADGIYGDQTAASVAEAQRLLELAGYDVPQDGRADAVTLALIMDDAARDALTTLCPGSKGSRVKELQNRLIDLKLLDGAADGAYGKATKTAVERFQTEYNRLTAKTLAVTGTADPSTQTLLMSDLSVCGFRAPIYFDASHPLGLTADDLYAKSCVVIDAYTGEALFGVAENARMYPASTTKIMTLLVSLDAGGLEAEITIPKAAQDVPEDSSLVPVKPGERMRKLDLLYGLIIRSGNDAANAVAVVDAGGVDAFVARMNQKAAQLQMNDTHFTNPHGYHDDGHYTTALDLAKLTRAGLTDSVFCQIVTCLSYVLPATEEREALLIQNTHEIFDPASPYYLPQAAGVKSGYTSQAGFCYVGAAQKDGKTLIAALLNVPSRNRAWLDLQKLFAYGFAK